MGDMTMRGLLFACVSVVVLSAPPPGTRPTVDTLSPASGPLTGGTVVTVKGKNLDFITHCGWGMGSEVDDQPVYENLYEGDEVKCEAPEVQSPTTTVLRVSEDHGVDWHPYYKKPHFTQYRAPVVEKFYPPHGPSMGNTEITLHVRGFSESEDQDKATCKFHTSAGDKVVPMVLDECEPKSKHRQLCYTKCVTPQVCYQHDPDKQVKCVEQISAFSVSLNGQNYHSNTEENANLTLAFRFDNEWTSPNSH